MDVALVQRGLARSRTRAAELIAEGGVIVNGQRTRKSSVMVTDDNLVEATDDRYVSRAAHKL
ncbi:MAG TPA: S4 domain-containing protein, partial [Propionibacteriaceae bacterium]|nr:S4 domain-containing protein [Propionibacteriaceae bacterium]